MTNIRVLLALACVFLFASCSKKDANFYRSKYTKNKADYIDAKNRLKSLLDKNGALYKIKVEFTGRRLIEYQYRDDTTIYFFEGINLSSADRKTLDNVMYKQGLQYIIAYNDSVKYVFGGMHKDRIVHYRSGVKPVGGNLIDTNTYLFFE